MSVVRWIRHSLPIFVAANLCFASACSRGVADSEGRQKSSDAMPPGAAATVPHGNHDPKYGGVVLMNGDLHFEVVLGREGRYQVYFSDALREELPASIASNVSVTVTRAGAAPEAVILQIDESGESWIGRGRPVDDPAHATARVAYTSQAGPYWIDVPFTAREGG
jgi:hypothetical protein